MDALIVVGTRVRLTPDGDAWTRKGTLGSQFWARYLDVYDSIRVLVRAERVAEAPAGWARLTAPSIGVCPLPDFPSISRLLLRYPAVVRGVREALRAPEAIHLRVPAVACDVVERQLEPGRPFGVEVVGDPWDVYSPGAIRHPLRPWMRRWATRRQQRQCRRACAAAYVTERHLQSRYPAAEGAPATHFSSIQLECDSYAAAPRRFDESASRRLIIVGSWEALYKAPDVLIDAVGELVTAGAELELEIVGDGPYLGELREQAGRRGIAGRVRFTGALASPDEVLRRLDAADLFVLPSRQEGLPRAMIEAMARGLPCIGSTAGGIPELLEAEDLVAPNDAAALARKIREVCGDSSRMNAMAKKNWRRSHDYRVDLLRKRRISFYRHVRGETERWLTARKTF